jgi:hypothetical protein
LTASSIVDLKPSIDQELQDNNMDGTFDEFIIITNSILQTTAHNGSGVVPVDRRGIMEFNLAPTQFAAQLQSASFICYVEGTSTPPGFTQLSIDLFGYQGDGQITVGDAIATNTKIGRLTITAGFPGFGKHEVPLDTALVAGLLQNSNYFGIVTTMEVNHGGIVIGSREKSLNQQGTIGPPTLRLVFAVPEPASAGIVIGFGFVACVSVASRRRRMES